MRTYLYSIARSRIPGSRFTQMSLGDVPMALLYDYYDSPVYMILSDTDAGGLVAVNMEDVRVECSGRYTSFQEYLNAMSTYSIPYMTGDMPVINTKYARYADAHYAGFKPEPVHPLGYVGAGITRAEKTWAKLVKPSIDCIRFYKTSLITINGFVHSTDADSTGVYVRDAFSSLEKAKINAMGIINFSEVCDLTFVPFKDMTISAGDSGNLIDECFVHLSEPMLDKVPLFIIGGYYFDSHPAFMRVANDTWRIRFSMLDLPNRFFEMREFMNVDSLGVEFDHTRPDMTLVSRLTNNDFITKLLQMTQSFMVFMNAADVFYEYTPLVFDKRAPWCETPSVPDKPVITDNGRFIDYTWQYGWDDHWILHAYHNFTQRNICNTHGYGEAPITRMLDPNNPLPVSKPFFLHIGKDI